MSSDEELHDQEPASPGPEEEEVNVDEVDDETLRIMVSTDNHLGYAEKDPIRGMDSFAAFEEVLYLAKRHKVRAVQMAQFVARNFFVFFVLDTFLCFSHDSASVAGTHPHHHMIGDVPKPIGWATSGNGALGCLIMGERGRTAPGPPIGIGPLSFFKISIVDLYGFLLALPTDMDTISPSNLDAPSTFCSSS